jgi:DNA-binding MarR family transcriptional regulator
MARTTPTSDPPKRNVLDPAMLRASGALLSAQAALGRLIDVEAVEPTGQDPTIVDLLTRLDLAPESRLRAVELSRQLLMSPSHISRTIDKAEALGLVERGPDPDDRRAAQISMTEAGRSVIQDFAPRLQVIIDRVVNDTLSETEIETLVQLLGRVEDAACQPCPEDSK